MGEAWWRPEDEAEARTADGSRILWGWGWSCKGQGRDAGVRFEVADFDPTLRRGRARGQPGRAALRQRWEVQATRAGVLRLCQTLRCQEKPGGSWRTRSKGLFEG